MITYVCVDGISYTALPDDPDTFAVLYPTSFDETRCPLCGVHKSAHHNPDECRTAHVTRQQVMDMLDTSTMPVVRHDWDRRRSDANPLPMRVD